MTTSGSQKAQCPHCAAAAVEAAAWDREVLAAVQHAIWSHWMRYLFSCGDFNDDGTWTMWASKVQRWCRQANTSYAGLSAGDKESDRHQADKVIAALPAVAALEEQMWARGWDEGRTHTMAQLRERLGPEWNEDGQGEPWCDFCRMLKSDGHIDTCVWVILGADNPSPAVTALERRLAPMPCGHPRMAAHHDEGTGHCEWCEDIAVLREEIRQHQRALIQQGERLERARALAALVPEPQLLNAAGSCLLEMLTYDSMGRLDIIAMADKLRALATRIEDVRRQQAQEDGDV